ncbi:hybrid sensor histidine kinase/response regulator [uncultured Maricaulis sp.]|uniref:hybrid sensor histidine kinase/response regulator n=1 Tax=uncultured Maricaulis sp. TaxID=174710 RepID=UPI0025D9AF87|nr:hybrid sensor histidine kinase/response regulator [uncultured Maricaulis sp.]
MTNAGTSTSDDGLETAGLSADLHDMRLDQARLLLARTGMSCLIIGGVILYLTVLIMLTGDLRFAAGWVAGAGGMVGVVFAYPRLIAPGGVTPANYRRYLTGHVFISGLTGLVWASFAIAFLDDTSLLNLFIAINMVFAITVGGMMPSAEYRPTFIALSSANLLPFTSYWLVTVEGPLRLIGVGLLIYYGFGLLVSARAEIQTQTLLAAERNRELTRRLQEQNALVERVSAEKSRFLAATSHDLAQPLQAQGFFIGAMRRTLRQAEHLELLDKIEACWSSQQQLLQALVETARLDSGAIVAKPRPFALETILQGLEQEFAEPARGHALTLESRIEAAVVDNDPLLLARILRNLLSNAVKFTPPGGQIRLVSRRDGADMLIEVSDNGPGIPSDELDRVFDEYVQLATPVDGGESGLGLGLPIVRQLASKLGAELEFHSASGEGTRAQLRIACAPADLKPTEIPDRPDRVTGTPLVVLVEDDAAIRDSLAIVLTDWNCRVVAAGSGEEAVNLLSWATSEPALLIVDKRLADGEDGLETIAALRAELAADTPAILLTGDIYQFEKLAGLADVTVITKPADPALVQSVLLEILARTSGAE